jgi:hypothetical protein
MQCPQCDKYLPDTISFCPYCGEPQYAAVTLPDWRQILRAIALGGVIGTVSMALFGLVALVWWGGQAVYQSYVARDAGSPMIATPSVEVTPTQKTTLVDYWGGPAHALALHESYLLQGVGSQLIVSNALTPNQPLSRLLLSSPIQHLTTEGEFIYLVTEDNHFEVVEFTNPTQPRLLNRQTLPAAVQKMQVINGYAYLLTDSELLIIKISYTDAPGRMEHYPTTARDLMGVAPYLYLVTSTAPPLNSNSPLLADSLQILELTNPLYPKKIAAYNDLIDVNVVRVEGNFIYLADHNKGLRVLENHPPDPPREIGLDSFSGQTQHLLLADNLAYLVYTTDNRIYLRVVDISDPIHPTPLIEVYPLTEPMIGLASYNQQLYLAAATKLQLLNTHDLPRLTVTTTYNYGLTQVSDFALSRQYAYIINNQIGLQVYNLANQALIGQYTPPNGARNIVITPNYGYLTNGTTLQVIDLSNPAELKPLGALALPNEPWRMAVVSDTYLYVVMGAAGLQIIDVNNARNPQPVGGYFQLAEVADAAAAGQYAYLAAAADGLQILDVHDPTSPTLISRYQPPTGAESHKVSLLENENENQKYLALASGNRLELLDVSQPMTPTVSSSSDFYDRLGTILELVPQGKLLYIAAFKGLGVVDISKPTELKLLTFYPTTTPPLALAVQPPNIYLVSLQGGVMVLQVVE